MIYNLFTSPTYTSNSSNELLISLKKSVSEISIASEQRGHSTVGGYQSDSKLFEKKDISITQLKKFIGEEAIKYWPHLYEALTGRKFQGELPHFEFWGWITSLESGGFNSPHIHPRSTISGVYYVKTPAEILENKEKSFAGWIGFMDPRSNAQIWPLASHLNYFFIPPVEGSLVLFPSYLQHFVPPFNAKGERISIAFNLRHKLT
jgi:uncharacterized protein (TIGR02466 family)